jgi:uncharacterized membrane protein
MSNSNRKRSVKKKGGDIEAVEQYSSPLPPSDEVQKWSELLPDAAERILKMAEDQAPHRRKLEVRITTLTFTFQFFAIAIGGAVCIGLIYIAYLCIMNEVYDTGTIVASLGISPIAIQFIRRSIK